MELKRKTKRKTIFFCKIWTPPHFSHFQIFRGVIFYFVLKFLLTFWVLPCLILRVGFLKSNTGVTRTAINEELMIVKTTIRAPILRFGIDPVFAWETHELLPLPHLFQEYWSGEGNILTLMLRLLVSTQVARARGASWLSLTFVSCSLLCFLNFRIPVPC